MIDPKIENHRRKFFYYNIQARTINARQILGNNSIVDRSLDE